jgi:hypothetical protein
MWVKIIFVVITVVFTMILVIKRFVYFRPTHNLLPPKDNYQDIYEGNLHAWYKKGSSGKVILFCHGNAGNLSHRQSKLAELHAMGHSVLIFDYSGFGQSRGVPNEEMLYANADMFIQYLLRNGYSKDHIVPYGESMGAAVAAYICRKYNLPRVILESSLPGVKFLAADKFGVFRFLSFIFNDFNTVFFMKGYRGRSLVMHCPGDEIIPYRLVDELVKNATVHVQMNGTHNNPQIDWKKVSDFLVS